MKWYLNPFKIGEIVRGKENHTLVRIDKIIDYHTIDGTIMSDNHPDLKKDKQYKNICIHTLEKIKNPITNIFKF